MSGSTGLMRGGLPRRFGAAPRVAAASWRAAGLRAVRMVRAASDLVEAISRGLRVAVLRPVPLTPRDAAACCVVARVAATRVAGLRDVAVLVAVFLADVAFAAFLRGAFAACALVVRVVFAAPRVVVARFAAAVARPVPVFAVPRELVALTVGDFAVRDTEPFGRPTGLPVRVGAFALRATGALAPRVVLVARVVVAARVVFAARVAAGFFAAAAFVVVAFFVERVGAVFLAGAFAAAALGVRAAVALPRTPVDFGRPGERRAVVFIAIAAVLFLVCCVEGGGDPVVSSVLMGSSLSSRDVQEVMGQQVTTLEPGSRRLLQTIGYRTGSLLPRDRLVARRSCTAEQKPSRMNAVLPVRAEISRAKRNAQQALHSLSASLRDHVNRKKRSFARFTQKNL